MKELIAIMLSGAAGTLCRYGIGRWSNRVLSDTLPFATLLVNVTGCLIFGFIMQVSADNEAIPRTIRLALTVGFLGAFTTFSTFGFETFQFMRDGQWWLAAANAFINMTLGFIAVWGGVAVGKVLFG